MGSTLEKLLLILVFQGFITTAHPSLLCYQVLCSTWQWRRLLLFPELTSGASFHSVAILPHQFGLFLSGSDNLEMYHSTPPSEERVPVVQLGYQSGLRLRA